jgi:hypothetical protein
MPEVQTLRVRRTRGKKVFPFDRVYLVRYEDRDYAKQLFRYALVLPVIGSLAYLLKQAVPDTVVFRPHDRNDQASVPTKIDPLEWDTFVDEGKWVMIVPLLTKYFVKEIEAHPRYLAAQEWVRLRDTEAGHSKADPQYPRDGIPSLSYLQTPDKNIRPICAACPRFIHHQAGECEIGQEICFNNLPMGTLDYFKQGLETPEASRNIYEEEIPAEENSQ